MKMTANDLELLRQFARDQAQDAFTELVRRQVNLVYSAALRQVRSPQLAEEVAQSVFSDLARNAGRLADAAGGPLVLTAWLYQVTRHTAVDMIRKESRRQLREQIALEINAMNAAEANWSDIERLLDEAVAALDDTDRAAVLLRYFENQSLRDVGQQLGMSDDAAQKRVCRAVEKLREFFAKRGVNVGAGGLVVVISANAVQAAPVGLAVTLSAAALAGTAVTTSTTIIAATSKTIAMTTLQKTLVTATVAVLAGAGIYESRQASQLREQNLMLQQQHTQMVEQLQQLQGERDSTTNKIDWLRQELAKNAKNNDELLKLRGEIGQLRQITNALRKEFGNNSSPIDSNPTTGVSPKRFLKGNLSFAGSGTPESAIESQLWAFSNGDTNTMLNLMSPEDREDIKSNWESFYEGFTNGMEEFNKITEFRILNKKIVSNDQVELQLQFVGVNTNWLERLPVKKINNEWKVLSITVESGN